MWDVVPFCSACCCLFDRSIEGFDRNDRLFPAWKYPPCHDRHFLVFIDRPTHELSACFHDTISPRPGEFAAAACRNIMTGYAVRVIASDTRLARSLFSYLPRGVATLHTTRIINVRGMSIGSLRIFIRYRGI